MLGAVWLNRVFQPCVMAAQTDMSMPGPCPHCPAPMSEDCEGVPANVCTYFDQVDYDGRIPHPKTIKKVVDGFVQSAASAATEQLLAPPAPSEALLQFPATGFPPVRWRRPFSVPIVPGECLSQAFELLECGFLAAVSRKDLQGHGQVVGRNRFRAEILAAQVRHSS